jgi:wyosine [tRNA(Phe)-imidazoG37] synthetase (radical SAM superfamily)
MEKQLIATVEAEPLAGPVRQSDHSMPSSLSKAFGSSLARSRNFFGNQIVYALISQRARGLSIGVNMNPDKFCNFDCVYCEVDRREHGAEARVNIDTLSTELRAMLGLVQAGRVRELPGCESVPEELLALKEVALSGDGEPTLCPNFSEVVETVVHLRAQGLLPFFKIVLITNATGLHLSEVQRGLPLLTQQDEIWAKLDVGSQEAMEKINRPKASPRSGPAASLAQVLENILALGRQRPVVIQSLFPLLDGREPSPEEVEQYIQRLRELKEGGGHISLVQIYSAHRPAVNANCGHLRLRSLSRIVSSVRQATGLRAEVF